MDCQRKSNPKKLLALEQQSVELGDSEEAIETIAYAHAPGMVLVEVLDRRARLIGYWLPIKDVARLP